MPPFTRAPAVLRSTHQLITRSTSSTLNVRAAALAATKPASSIQRPTSSRNASTQSTHGVAAHAQSGEEHHGDGAHNMYEPPTGWLWGVPPGEQYKKEGWEGLWYWGFCGSLVLTAVAYAFKPDTSIETWALEEAKRRLQVEGILPEED